MRYLTGFTGSAGSLLVSADDAMFVTDGRYRTQSAEQLAAAGVDARVEIGLTMAEQREMFARAAAGFAQRRARGALGHVGRAARLRGRVRGRRAGPGGDARRGPAPGEGRGRGRPHPGRVRDRDDAFESLLSRFGDGITEREFALALEFAMRERGASGNSFDPIIASGPNGAKPHANPSDRVIERNELIVCDFGCIVDGYCSDMTRTVSVGDPGPDARHLYDVVLESQQAGRAAVAANVECADIDRASRDVIAEAGWADAFSHSTGHGVGLEIHEAPRVASTARDTLLVGDVVTVEPGVYLPGVGGVRIEDTVVVTATGAEPLTLTPKDLVL